MGWGIWIDFGTVAVAIYLHHLEGRLKEKIHPPSHSKSG